MLLTCARNQFSRWDYDIVGEREIEVLGDSRREAGRCLSCSERNDGEQSGGNLKGLHRGGSETKLSLQG